MADQDLVVKISADTASAVQGLNTLNTAVQQSNNYLKLMADAMEKAEKASKSAGEAAVELNQALELANKAIELVGEVFEKTVEKFIDADSAAQTLSNTFRLLGDKDVAGAVEHMEEFAKTIEATSTVSSETVIKLGTMATAIGLNTQQTEELIKASVNLSAVTGKDVKQTFDELLMTYKGVARGVAEYDKNTQSLSVSQLKNGEAVKMISEKYKGFAEAQSTTLGGQLVQVRNLFSHTLVDIGQMFSEFFKLGDQHLAIEALKALNEFMENTVIPKIKAMREEMDKFFTSVSEAWGAVKDKGSVVEATLTAIGTAMAIAFGPTVLEWLGAFVIQLGTAAISMAAIAVQVIALTSVILVLASAVQVVYLNFQNLDKLGTVVIDVLIIGFRSFGDFIIDFAKKMYETFVDLFKSIGSLFSAENFAKLFSGTESIGEILGSKIKASFSKTFSSLGKSTEELTKEMKHNAEGLDFGIAGKAIEGIGQLISGLKTPIASTTAEQDKLKNSVKGTSSAYTALSQDAQKALLEVGKKVTELNAKAAEISGNELQISKNKLAVEMLNIDALKKQLEDKGALNEQGRILIANARSLAQEDSDNEGFKKQMEALDKLGDQTAELNSKVNEFGKTQSEIIDMNLEKQLDAIENTYTQLKAQGLLTDEMKAQLHLQQDLAKKNAGQQKQAAPEKLGESLKIAGDKVGKGISDAFGPLTGLSSAVGSAVGAAQAVVDAIPQMLESVTNLISSITQLPLKILNDFNKLLESVLQFLAQILPNLVKAISGILTSAVSFLQKLPGILVKAVLQIPDLVVGLVKSLPKILTDLIKSLADGLPALIVGFIKFLVEGLPVLVKGIVQAIPEIISAVVVALWEGVKSIAKSLGDLLAGKGFHIDSKSAVDAIKNVANEISKSSSKLFAVTDLGNAAKDATQIVAEVDKAGKDAVNALLKAWKWIYDNILKPIGDLVMKAFQWVWDNVFAPLANFVMGIFKAVWAYLEIGFNIVVALFTGAWDLLKVVGTFIGDYLKSAFDFAKGIFDVIIDAFKDVWKIATVVFSAIWDNLKAVWNGIIEILKAEFDAVGEIFKGIGTYFKSVFSDIWDGLKSIWNTIMDIFTGKISLFDGIGKIFGTIFDTGAKLFTDAFNLLKTIGDAVGKIFSATFDALGKILKTFTDGAGKIGEAIWNAFKDLFSKAADVFGKAGTAIWEALAKLFKGATDVFADVGTAIWNAIKDGLMTVGSILMDTFKNLGSAIFDGLKSSIQGAGSTFRKVFGFAEGGYVPGTAPVAGNSSRNDTVLSLLSPGEAVINRQLLANKHVKKIIDAILASQGNFDLAGFMEKEIGRPQKFADGGIVGVVPMGNLGGSRIVSNARAASNNHTNTTNNISINMTIANSGAPIDDKWVKSNVFPAIKEELKKATLRGELLVSKKGVY